MNDKSLEDEDRKIEKELTKEFENKRSVKKNASRKKDKYLFAVKKEYLDKEKRVSKFTGDRGWYIENSTFEQGLKVTMRKCISCGKLSRYDDASQGLCSHCKFDIKAALSKNLIKVN